MKIAQAESAGIILSLEESRRLEDARKAEAQARQAGKLEAAERFRALAEAIEAKGRRRVWPAPEREAS